VKSQTPSIHPSNLSRRLRIKYNTLNVRSAWKEVIGTSGVVGWGGGVGMRWEELALLLPRLGRYTPSAVSNWAPGI